MKSILTATMLLLNSRAMGFSYGASWRASSRLLSMRAGALPTDDEGKAFYALGVNIARQVGGELKGVLSPEEIDHMVIYILLIYLYIFVNS